MTRARWLLIPALTLALLLSLAPACGGGGDGNDGSGGTPATMDAYFTELGTIGMQLDDTIGPAGQTLSSSEDLGELKDAFATYPEALTDFIDGLDGLTPPAAAADAHQATIDAAQAFLDELESTNERVQDTESVDDFLTAADTPELGTLNDALTDTCLDLQAIADENGIDVDLGCLT